jgi:rubredoxin
MNKVTSYQWPCPACGQATNYFENDAGAAWAYCRNCGWQKEAAPVLGRDGKPIVGKDGRWAYRVSERQVTLHNLDDKARVASSLLPGMRPARDDSGWHRLLRWFKNRFT